jgi:hypothetical protein
LLPLVKGGEFSQSLAKSRDAALRLFGRLKADERFVVAFEPELDLVIFAARAESVSAASGLPRRIFEAAAKRGLHLALAELPVDFFAGAFGVMERDRETITCLRSVLMKPEHLDWIDRIWETLIAATDEVCGD